MKAIIMALCLLLSPPTFAMLLSKGVMGEYDNIGLMGWVHNPIFLTKDYGNSPLSSVHKPIHKKLLSIYDFSFLVDVTPSPLTDDRKSQIQMVVHGKLFLVEYNKKTGHYRYRMMVSEISHSLLNEKREDKKYTRVIFKGEVFLNGINVENIEIEGNVKFIDDQPVFKSSDKYFTLEKISIGFNGKIFHEEEPRIRILKPVQVVVAVYWYSYQTDITSARDNDTIEITKIYRDANPIQDKIPERLLPLPKK